MPRRLAVWKTAGPGRSVRSVRAERLAPPLLGTVPFLPEISPADVARRLEVETRPG